jgi:hypothetical protein
MESSAVPAPKTKIRTSKTKPKGRVRGVPGPSTEAVVRHARVANWKHGLRATIATAVDARREKMVATFGADAPAVVEAFQEAIDSGDLAGTNAIAVQSLAETEILRRKVVDEIAATGLVVSDVLFNEDGEPIGQRLRAHPLLDPLRHMNDTLGHTAADMQLSRKSRGEGAKDEAIAAMLKRDEMLRGISKDAMALPPPAED